MIQYFNFSMETTYKASKASLALSRSLRPLSIHSQRPYIFKQRIHLGKGTPDGQIQKTEKMRKFWRIWRKSWRIRRKLQRIQRMGRHRGDQRAKCPLFISLDHTIWSISKGKTSSTQEDIPWPCTSSITQHVEDSIVLVWTVSRPHSNNITYSSILFWFFI